MQTHVLYPLRFEPIYQYRLWGGQRLANVLSAPLPGDGPIGEAWLLSDREDHPSRVANGPFKPESIWISSCPMPPEGLESHRPGLFNSHHRLATPVSPWEMLKIGGGTPPILTRHGWLILCHGVRKMLGSDQAGRAFRY